MTKPLQGGHGFLALLVLRFKWTSSRKISKGRTQAQKGKGLVNLGELEALVMNKGEMALA